MKHGNRLTMICWLIDCNGKYVQPPHGGPTGGTRKLIAGVDCQAATPPVARK
jgi:hypothetical protein